MKGDAVIYSLLILISQGSIINANIFSNPFELQKLYARFLQIGYDIQMLDYFPGKEKIMKDCHHFWLDIHSGSYKPIEDKILENLVSNPIHNFQLMESIDLIEQYLLPFLMQNRDNETLRIIHDKLLEIPSKEWPSDDEDFHLVLDGLLRVQYTYQLPISDLAKGLIRNRKTNAYLSPEDSTYIENQAKTAFSEQDHMSDYMQLCRDGSSKSSKETCEFRHGNDAWLRIGPIKTEVISKEQFSLLLCHDVLSSDQMKFMKSQAEKRLSRAGLYNAVGETRDDAKLRFTTERTQSHAWLWEAEFEELPWISRKIESISRLKVVNLEPFVWTSEGYQVGVYTPGGVFLPHFDALQPLDIVGWFPNGTWIGNRIATAMFYLSDVDGGATVFPNQGIAVNPKKGSMLFWYDLNHEGKNSIESEHGGCPTLYGLKWVSNKWIREGEQIFHRKCQLRHNV